MSGVKIKICGITNLADALAAVEAGADALGFVFYPPSLRCIQPEEARRISCQLPPFVTRVGVFVDEALDRIREIAELCGLGAIQLHGHESPELCRQLSWPAIKGFRLGQEANLTDLAGYTVSAILIDSYVAGTYGGTGQRGDWGLARRAKAYGRIILAGGLSPQNVEQAIREVAPYAVDVSSGVERAPGLKDPDKIREFVRRARCLDEGCQEEQVEP